MAVKTRTQLAAKNTTINILFKLISMLASFVIKTAMIKSMGIQYTGVSSLFTDILTLLSLAELGIGTAITYSLYKPLAEKNYKEIAKYMNFYRRAYSVIGISVFIVGLLVIPFMPFLVTNVPDVKESITTLYLLYLINTSLSYFLVYKSSLLIANQENYKVTYIQSLFTLVKVVIQTTILISSKNFYLFLIFDIVITFIQNIVISNKADKDFNEIKKYSNLHIEDSERKKLFSNVMALAMYQVSGVIVNSTDSIIVSAFLGTGIVAFMSNYRLIIRSVDGFIVQITASLTPSIGNYVASNELNDKQVVIFRKVSFISFCITLLSSMMLLFLTNPFISIWLGKEYVLNNSILVLFVIDYILVNLVRPVATFRNANGLFVQGKWRPMVMAIMNIVLSLLLVNRFGITGVLLGTIISRLLTQTWFDPLILYKYAFNRSLKSYISLFGKYIFCFFISVILIGAVERMILRLIFSNVVILFLNFFLSTMIPLGVIIFLYKKSPELEYLMSMFKEIGSKCLKKFH